MAYLFPDTVLLIFCKAPVPGQVKTRLTPDLTPKQATETHRQLALQTLQMAYQQPCCPIQLWCSPTIQDDFFSYASHAFPLTLHQQQGDDLGARMLYALTAALKTYNSAILIGTDCPVLAPTHIFEACEGLSGNDVVLIPAEDGGYVLMGCNTPQAALFENMPWGSSRVLALTRERLHRLSLKVYEFAALWDVDTINDYHRWLNCSPAPQK